MEGKRMVNIVSGFLGAGKTTFISRLMDINPNRENIAICVNEFATQGVDGIVFRGKTADVKELSAGCICCTLKKVLSASLADLIFNSAFERLFIEPSGIGKLSEVLDAVNSPSFKKYVTVGKALTVVDAANFYETFHQYEEIAADQVRYADVLVLSKVEGLSPEYLAELCRQLKELNPDAKIYSDSWTDELLHEIYSSELPGGSRTQERGQSGSGADACNVPLLQTLSVNLETPVEEEEVRELVRQLCSLEDSHIARMKGLLAHRDGGAVKVDYVQGQLTMERTQLEAVNKLMLIGSGLKFAPISAILADRQVKPEVG